jgi:hypothetical protein
MKTGLIDASSAILLYKADLFTAVSAAYRLKVAPAVLKEITVVKRKGASFFQRAFDTGSLFPAEPGPEADASTLPALGDGERETLMAFRNDQGDFVIIDDGRGAAACRTDAIPISMRCSAQSCYTGLAPLTGAPAMRRSKQFWLWADTRSRWLIMPKPAPQTCCPVSPRLIYSMTLQNATCRTKKHSLNN